MGFRCFSKKNIGGTFRYRGPCISTDQMYVLIGILIIVGGALAVSAINHFVASSALAAFLQIVLLIAVAVIFVWFR
jgi:hypothetical protein